MADVKNITVQYEDETIKELKKGFIAELDKKMMKVDMVDISEPDIVRITYGMIAMVDQMGLVEMLKRYLNGEILPDEQLDIKPSKVPKNDEENSFFECPTCKQLIYYTDNKESHKYCLNCGQALSWKQAEEDCGCCQREDAPCEYCIRDPENDKEDPDLEDYYYHD